MLSIHCGACFWVIIASLHNESESDFEGTWAEDYYEDDHDEKTKGSLYTIATYWMI